MDIKEMHNTFRVFGQQMGMQTNRGILPESIDVYLNSSILEIVRQGLIAGVTNSINEHQNRKATTMSVINKFETLYATKQINIEENSIINLPDDFNPMMRLGVSLKYKDDNKRYDCRIIPIDNLELTLNDYCNNASKKYPIVTFIGNSIEIYANVDNNVLDKLYIKYIKYPKKVDYDKNVSCDLPEYIHEDVVQLAVEKFIQSIHGKPTPQAQPIRVVN